MSGFSNGFSSGFATVPPPDPYPVLASVLDAVVEEVNTAKPQMILPYEAEWTYTPFYDPVVDKGVKLQVASALVEIEDFTRGEDAWNFNVGVAVYSSVKITDKSAVNKLVLLVQQLADYFRQNTHLSQYPDAAITSTKIDAMFDPESLREKNTFLGVVRLTVQVLR